MSTVLMVGTRKGLWIGTSDDAREEWEFTGPHHDMEEVYSCMVDTRGDRPRLLLRRLVQLARAAGPLVRRPRRELAGVARRRHPVPRGRRTRRSSGSGSWRPAPRPASSRPAPSPARSGAPTTAASPSRSSGRSGTTRTGPSGAPASAARPSTRSCRTRRPGSVTVAISTGGVYQTNDGGASWAPRNQGIRAEFLPEGQQYPEFGQCVHKVTRHPVPPRAALPAEPRRRLPLRRPRRVVGVHRGRAARPTSASRSSCTRTSRTRSSCSRSTAARAATRRTPRPGSGARATPASTWEELGKGLPDDFFVGVMRDAMCADAHDPAGPLLRRPQRRGVGLRRRRARAGARSWPTSPT